MQFYKTQTKRLTGTNFRDIRKKSFGIYQEIRRKSKRRPYIRSVYFKKEKIFLGLFWQHLYEKRNYRDQVRRMQFFPCAVELIKHTHYCPTSKENADKRSEILHRFGGITPNNEIFFVQIKEDKRSGEKFLISVFPLGK